MKSHFFNLLFFAHVFFAHAQDLVDLLLRHILHQQKIFNEILSAKAS